MNSRMSLALIRAALQSSVIQEFFTGVLRLQHESLVGVISNPLVMTSCSGPDAPKQSQSI